MPKRCWAWAGIVALVVGVGSRGEEASPSEAKGRAVFEGQVRALLTGKCLTCHARVRRRGGST